MPQCTYYDEGAEAVCGVNDDTVKGGRCPAHTETYKKPPPKSPQFTAVPQWTSATAMQSYKATKDGSDGTGGLYYGGGSGSPHVHLYGDGGAHVKVGNKECRFLMKPDFSFSPTQWAAGLEAIKERNGAVDHLIKAMVFILAQKGKVNDAELTKIINALG
jgi:hypothetical protein